MADVFLYNDVSYALPKQPKNNLIQGYDLPKKNQKWKRTELPKNWDELDEDEQWTFSQEEDRRCSEGFWFYNCGVPTYVNGDNYFYLNWFKLDVGFPQYRDRDRRWFYFWEICDKDKDCLGMAYGKLRRDGYSFRVCSVMLNRARKTFNAKYGIISKSGDDAKEMFNKFVYAFKNLPSFFKPQTESSEEPKKDLWLKAPVKKVTQKNRKPTAELSLETLISWKNTAENSYDGSKQQILAADEAGKFPKDVSIEKWFNIGKTCLTLGSGKKIIGKMHFGSTVNESEKGGKGFKKIWGWSLNSEKTLNDKTASGLYRYFVPAYDGLEGFVDEYGISVIEDPIKPIIGIDGELITIGAKTYLANELKSKKDDGDTVGYYEQLRQFPCCEDDMFRDPANETNSFDIERIYQQLDHNSVHNPKLRRGNFVWVNGKRDGTVEFKEDAKGRFLIAWMPAPDKRNNKMFKNGKVAPGNVADGCFGADPFDHKTTTDGRKSDAAIVGFLRGDLMMGNSNSFVLLYCCRPPDPNIVYEDALMASVFYGWELLPETNKPGMRNYFEDRGFVNYIMERPSNTHTEYSKANTKDEKGISTTGESVRSKMVEGLQSYIYNSIGINEETGKIGYCPFDELLNDWVKFDPNKWTDYDLTVATMLCIMGANRFIPTKKVVQINIPELFRRYDNTGNMSKRLK